MCAISVSVFLGAPFHMMIIPMSIELWWIHEVLEFSETQSKYKVRRILGL